MNWKKEGNREVNLGNGFFAEIYDTNVNMSMNQIHKETKKRQQIIVGAPRAVELLRSIQNTKKNLEEITKSIKEFLDEYDD